jgi:hypothetical protein
LSRWQRLTAQRTGNTVLALVWGKGMACVAWLDIVPTKILVVEAKRR